MNVLEVSLSITTHPKVYHLLSEDNGYLNSNLLFHFENAFLNINSLNSSKISIILNCVYGIHVYDISYRNCV